MTSKCRQTLPSAARIAAVLFFCLLPFTGRAFPQGQPGTKPDFLIAQEPAGQRGGRLVLSLRSEPKTLNPIIASDAPSREVIGVMQADLVHINRSSQLT